MLLQVIDALLGRLQEVFDVFVRKSIDSEKSNIPGRHHLIQEYLYVLISPHNPLLLILTLRELIEQLETCLHHAAGVKHGLDPSILILICAAKLDAAGQEESLEESVAQFGLVLTEFGDGSFEQGDACCSQPP